MSTPLKSSAHVARALGLTLDRLRPGVLLEWSPAAMSAHSCHTAHCTRVACAAGRGLPASDRLSQSTPRAFNRHCARLALGVSECKFNTRCPICPRELHGQMGRRY